MRRQMRFSCWLVGGWLGVLVAPLVWAQQQKTSEPDTVRISTALVTLNVSVTDKQGQPIARLRQPNFAIYEDGKLQELDFFGAEDQPVSLGLLIDRSQSMGDTGKLENAKAVVQSFLRAGNPQNEAFCLAFNETAGLVTDFTSDYSGMAAPLTKLWAEGGTALYDAIHRGLEHLQQGQHRRRALVVVTDGGDQHSQIKLDALLKRAQQSNTQIFLIGFFSPHEAASYRTDAARLELSNGQWVDNPRVVFNLLAAETGAETFFPRSVREFEKTAAEIANRLRAQYTLAYYPNNQATDDRYRKIEVRLQNVPGGRVKTRQGYRLSEPLAVAVPVAESPAGAERETPKSASALLATAKTRSAASEPPVLYRESFEQPRDAWPQTAKAYVKNGKYHVHGQAALPLPLFQYHDFELTVQTAMQDEAPAFSPLGATELDTLGVSFRNNPNGYYEVMLSPLPGRRLGTFILAKVLNGQRTILRRVEREPIIGLSNQIKVRCRGPQIELFINGLLVAALKDEAHAAGSLSLLFNGQAATFDEIVVKRLD